MILIKKIKWEEIIITDDPKYAHLTKIAFAWDNRIYSELYKNLWTKKR